MRNIFKSGRCSDYRGNQVCTNGKDTYHEYNARYSTCIYCGKSEPSNYCECERCEKCGKLIK